MSNVVTTAKTAPVKEIDPFEAHGQSGNEITGELLRFSKGDFVAGTDGRMLPVGTQLVANMATYATGWTRWEGGKPAEYRMGPVAEGFKAPWAQRARLQRPCVVGARRPGRTEEPLAGHRAVGAR